MFETIKTRMNEEFPHLARNHCIDMESVRIDGRPPVAYSDKDPKYIIYVYGKTKEESYLNTRRVLSRLVAIYLEFASDTETHVETSTQGPSFCKMLTPMIWYTQGGYPEVRRHHIQHLNDMNDKIEALKKAGFEGPNLFKHSEYDDPGKGLGPSSALLASIDRFEDLQNSFRELLWTHNSPLESAKNILDYGYIRPGDLGTQFRYGLDSQYGHVKFVMRRNFEKNKSGRDAWATRRNNERKSTNEPYFYSIFEQKENKHTLEGKFKRDEAKRATYITYQRGACVGENPDTPLKTWCNHQMHLDDVVYMDDVLFVIAPSYVRSEIENLKLPEDLNKKIKYVEAGPDDYVETRDENGRIVNLRKFDSTGVPEECCFNDVRRDPDEPKHVAVEVIANSSKVFTCKETFLKEQRLYFQQVAFIFESVWEPVIM